MFTWLRQCFRAKDPEATRNRPLTPEQHAWIFAHFPGAWSLQTADPGVFGQEPEWNAWAYLGPHRLFFSNLTGLLQVTVAVNYCREGLPLCHLRYELSSEALRQQFLDKARELAAVELAPALGEELPGVF